MNSPLEEVHELFRACHCGVWDLKWSLALHRFEKLETNLQIKKLPASKYIEGRTVECQESTKGRL